MILGNHPCSQWLAIVFCLLVLTARAQTPEETAEEVRDSLVYKDGDRLHGRLVERTPDTIIFKSDRFGEIRVPAADAVVIKAEPAPKVPEPKPPVAVVTKTAPREVMESAAEKAEKEQVSVWNWFSPAVLTARVREFFGPWHGRIAVSNEIVVDRARRDSLAIDTKIARKFKKDTVEITARYDYNKTNGILTSDMLKSTGSWRREFTKRQFAQYRPTIEWNRVGVRRGIHGEYFMLQQEVGYGLNLLSTPARKVRFGISENLFDIWSWTPDEGHSSKALASMFDEVEFALPWRMTFTQRGVWYPVDSATNGWENRAELNKKLTETLSVAVRHELRRDNPDGGADHTRLRLLLGLDF